MNTPTEFRLATKTFTFDEWQPHIEQEQSYRERVTKDFEEFLAELIEAAGGTPAEDKEE